MQTETDTTRELTIELPVRFIGELSAATTLDEALAAIARWFSSMVEADRVSLALERTGTHLRLIALDGNQAIPLDTPIPIEGSMVGRVFRRRQAEACADFAGSEDWDCRMLAAGGLGSCLDVPLVHRGRCFGTLNVAFACSDRFTPALIGRMNAIASWIAANIHGHVQLERLAALSSQDPLTGLLNRRAFAPALAGLARRSAEKGGSFGLALIDLDHFKSVNDRFGHAVGDTVLVNAARILDGLRREDDVVARLGGEEFCLALSPIDAHEMRAILGRFSSSLAHSALVREGRVERITASIGAVLNDRPGETVDEMIERADHAMYRAKRSGRDRIVFAGLACDDRKAISA